MVNHGHTHLYNLGGGDGTPIKLLLRIGPREGVESPSQEAFKKCGDVTVRSIAGKYWW